MRRRNGTISRAKHLSGVDIGPVTVPADEGISEICPLSESALGAGTSTARCEREARIFPRRFRLPPRSGLLRNQRPPHRGQFGIFGYTAWPSSEPAISISRFCRRKWRSATL